MVSDIGPKQEHKKIRNGTEACLVSAVDDGLLVYLIMLFQLQC